ncbi:MAG TPA: MFS transporter [Aggregatilineales bacterium]|nr:MFS transporter [Anaerolineales bacterium]HRE46740.1 MFS transporter [Aggregatilineales bacterium]
MSQITQSITKFIARPSEIPSDVELHNRRLLYIEILFAGVLGGVITFNATFAVRLGATKEHIALLNSIPALVAALFSIPTALFVQRRVNRERWIFRSLFALRLGYGLLAAVPLLFGATQTAAVAVVIWIILLNIPTIFFQNGFQALLAELVPSERRAMVFSMRTAIWSAVVVVTSILAGQWLDWIAFPLNFMILYGFGFLVAMGSNWLVGNLIIPPRKTTMIALSKKGQSAPAALPTERARLTTPVARLLFNTGIYQSGLWLSNGLFAVFYIEILHASNGWIGLNLAVGSFGVVLGNFLWARLLRRRSMTWGLKRAILFTWFFPIGVAVFPYFDTILILNLLVNLGHPGVELCTISLMMKVGSDETRTVYMSWYNTVIQISAFVAPLVGVWIAQRYGIQVAFLIASLLRIIGATLFYVRPVVESSGG